jgi:hypothetical protein
MIEYLKKEWSTVFTYFSLFVRNPLKEIRTLPNWEWQTLIFVNGALGAACGSLNGLFSGNFLWLFLGLIVFPITFIVADIIISGFFYYFFLFVTNKDLPFKSIFTLLTLANIPFLALYIISPLASPLTLIGVAISGILLIVGFVDNFQLPKKIVVRLVAVMFGIHFLMWIWGTIQVATKNYDGNSEIQRENLDILEKELKGK